MIRKAMACGSLALLGSFSFGQALTLAETEVDQAFKNLRGSGQALFSLRGTDYIGSSATPIGADLFYNRPAITLAQDLKMELVESRNAIQTRRVVADGRHVWGIDLLTNTYSTALYGSYTGAKPTDYEQNGFQSLNVFAKDQSVWLARWAREVWAGMDAVYRPWIPASNNRSEFTVMGVGTPYPDPVVPTRKYASSDTKKFHVYWLSKSGTPTKSLTFELDENTTTSSWDLTAIYYSELSRVGTQQRLIDWKATTHTGLLPFTGNFTYAPPAGARAIAGPRPNGSG